MSKVIIVSEENVYEYISGLYPYNSVTDEGWDIQPHVSNVAEMWAGLDNGTVSADSDIIIFTDSSIVNNDEDEQVGLINAITQLAPHALVLVLFYDYANNYERLQQAVYSWAETNKFTLANFYAVDTAQPDITEEFARAFGEYGQKFENNSHIIRNEDQWTGTATQMLGGAASHQAPAGMNSPSVSGGTSYTSNYGQPEEAPKKRGVILASTSSKGGSGKTTVALCTATMLYYASKAAAEQGLRDEPLKVVIVDLDIRDGQVGFNIDKSAPTALNIYVDESENPSYATIQNNLVTAERLGIHALLAPKRPRTASHLDPGFYQGVIGKLSEMFDVVILDTSVNYLDTLLAKVAFPLADKIMFVADLSAGAVYGMTRWVEEVTSPESAGGSSVDPDKIGIVVNKSAQNLGVDKSLLEQAASGTDLVVAIPLDSNSMIAASNKNKLNDIILYHPTISSAYYGIIEHFFPDEVFADPYIGSDDVPGGGNRAAPAKSAQNPIKDMAPAKKRGGFFGRK